MDIYLVSVYVVLGALLALSPNVEEGDPWWIEWVMPLVCAIIALCWPIFFVAHHVLHKKKLKQCQGG